MDFSSILSGFTSALSKVLSAVTASPRKLLYTKYGFQLRAKIMPYSTCFSHSVSNMLSALGVQVSPDTITATVNGPEYREWVRQNVSWAVAYFGRLQTVWHVQERFIKQTLKENGLDRKYRVVLNWNTTRDYILASVKAGCPVVIDTYPIYYKTQQKLGHIVAVVGYHVGYAPIVEDFSSADLYNQYVSKFGSSPRDCYIVDDPFGNMLGGYVGNENAVPVEGDDLLLPMEWFDGVKGVVSLTLQEIV